MRSFICAEERVEQVSFLRFYLSLLQNPCLSIGNPKKEKFIKYFLCFLIFAGLCLRFYSCFKFNPIDSLWSDPGRHWTNATMSIEDVSQNYLAAFDPILYQVWLGAITKITLQDRFAIGVYAGLMSVSAPIIWFLYFRQVFSKKLALITFLLLTYLPSWASIYSYFMNETLVIPMLGLAMYFSNKDLKAKSMKTLCWSTVFWLLASLSKASVLPLSLIALAYQFSKHNQKFKKLLSIILISAVMLFPSGYRAYQIIKVFAPFGYSASHTIYLSSGKRDAEYLIRRLDGQEYFLNWGNPSLYVKPFAPFSDWQANYEGKTSHKIDLNNGTKDWNEALSRSAVPFPKSLEVRAHNLLFLFFAQQWPDSGNEQNWWSVMNVQARWLWLPLFLFCMIGSLVIWKRDKKLPLFFILNLLAWVLLCVSINAGESRYHKPFEGLMIGSAVWLVAKLAKREMLQAKAQL